MMNQFNLMHNSTPNIFKLVCNNQGCEWEFKKRAEIVHQLVKIDENNLKTQKEWPENTRKSTFWVLKKIKKL